MRNSEKGRWDGVTSSRAGTLCLLFFAACLGCTPGSDPGNDAGSGSDDATSGADAPGADAPGADAPAITPDASVSGLCPTYDPSSASQVTLGRASSGPAVIDADTTWTADHTYFVIGSLDIQGVALTIEAGTHVCLDAGAGAPPTLDFRAGSTLVANGTAAAPIVFAPATPDSTWSSLTLAAMDDATLDHVRLIGGGAGGSGVLRIESGYASPFVAHDVHVESVSGIGISLRADVGLDPGTSLYVDSQSASAPGPAIESTLLAAGTLDASTLHLAASLPASARRVQLTDNVLETSVTLGADLAVPFVTAGDVQVLRADASSPIPTLTLEAGVTLLFTSGSLLQIGSSSGLDADGGNLVALGRADAPITFASAESTPAAGDWGGIEIFADAFEPTVTRLEHVVVSDAGGDSMGSDILHCSTLPDPITAAIRIHASASLPYEGPAIDAAELTRSAGDGLAFTCLPTRCLTTDYSGHVSGTGLAGVLLRDRGCP